MIRISKRLTMAASLISEDGVLADVGTDHGYVPIYLVEQGKIRRAIAMDINSGPLERAREHVAQYGMEQYIETRLSDGVDALAPGEADSILIAGMGGGLVIHILTEGREVCRRAKELVLQPQSELERVRRFLAEEGYVTAAEEMIEEDGKYYPMMRVHYKPQDALKGQMAKQQDVGKRRTSGQPCGEDRQEDAKLAAAYLYGGLLLERQHPVLKEFLQKEQRIYEEILANLRKQPKTEQILLRTREIETALKRNMDAQTYYRSSDM